MCSGEGEDDDIPDLSDPDLKAMTLFYRTYLIGKLLGEVIAIKLISTRCSLDWKVAGEVGLIL